MRYTAPIVTRTMKITGYRLREAIKMHEIRRNTSAAQFDLSLRVFKGEETLHPQVIAKNFLTAEQSIARLQEAQARYNLAVSVVVLNETMTLCEAVKRTGGANRLEALWREAAGGKKDRYHGLGREEERDPTKERARATMTIADITKEAQAASKFAGALRGAIATANTQEVEVQDLDAALFE